MRNRSVTFHPDPRLPLLSLPLQLPACPPGGFSSLSALEGVAHRRLGEPSLPAAAAGAHKVHRSCATSFTKLRRGPFSHLRLCSPKRMSFVDVDQRVFFPFFHTSISISAKGCTDLLSTDSICARCKHFERSCICHFICFQCKKEKVKRIRGSDIGYRLS